MKKLISTWMYAASLLFSDDLISFYTFFTVIFAEAAYLYAFYPLSTAVPFIIILLGYILNVISTAYYKGEWEGTKKELLFARWYQIEFALMFLIGCLINLKMSIILTAIPLAITWLFIEIRELDTVLGLFISHVAIVIVPFVAFTVCWTMMPIPIIAKIIVPIAYFLVMPLIALLEDETAACNIFELAYDIY